ncbi:hypothetical protein K466DRAFT_505584, partial [Polyporus arcularius HHB13444]
RRINRLLVNAELSPPAFLISNIPLDTQWESFPAGTLLSVKHTHIRVRVIGQLRDINVLHEADMVPRAEVELTPLRETDREAMHDLLRLAVSPPSTLRLPQTLTAAKHMTAMRSRVPLIFNTTDDLRLPSVMEHLDFDKINDGDIVLVEVVLTREFLMTGWTTSFWQDGVALLLRCPS